MPKAEQVGNSGSIIDRRQWSWLFPRKLLTENLAKLVGFSGSEDAIGKNRKGVAGHEDQEDLLALGQSGRCELVASRLGGGRMRPPLHELFA